uniref:Nephrocystin 3-like N-terminal domain-containing protein n=1 Tax=Bionectria ochroleuca TaxID=29856 RepID=A0A8H7KD73_BIOOC
MSFRSFYETVKIGPSLIVDEASVRLNWPNEKVFPLPGSNHLNISKFGGEENGRFGPVGHAVLEVVQEALKDHAVYLPADPAMLSIEPELSVATLSDDYQQGAASALAEYTNKIGLQWNGILHASNPRTWKEKEHCAQVWLYGIPGDGKTVVMSYVQKRLLNHYGYAKKLDVTSIFCSADHTESCLVASLAFQLIRNDLRAHAAKTEIKSWPGLLSGGNSTNHLWELLETLITRLSAFETVFLIDGIAALKRDTRSSFLTNFLTLEKQVQSNATIRVLISSRPFSDIQIALAHYASIEREQERKEFLSTLFFKEWSAREARVETVDGGSWLASNHAYLEWNRNESSDVLWIEGKPGSGKSTLSKLIVRKLKKEQMDASQNDVFRDGQRNTREDQGFGSPQDWNTIIAEFYYSFRGGITETSHELMLRSIVYQIWKQNRRLFPLLRDRYRQLKEMSDNEAEKMSLWSYDDLRTALQSLHQIDFPLKIVNVVDGMDESDNARRDDVLGFLPGLSTRTSHCTIKILIASRPETDIKLHLARARRIVLQEVNTEDIQKVVATGIEKLKRLSTGYENNETLLPSERNRDRDSFSTIKDYIVDNSRGVFLWVSLILRDLEKPVREGRYTMTSLNKRVRKLPKDLGGLDGFYRAMVNSLIRRQDVRDPRFDRIVQLIHQTAREFLLERERVADPYDLDEVRGDTEIAATCSQYIRIAFLAETLQMEADTEFSQVDLLTSYLSELNLLEYSLTNFVAHLDHLGSKGEYVRTKFEAFIADLRGRPTSYPYLLLSRWVEALTWPRDMHTGTNEEVAILCLQTALTQAAGAGRDQAVDILLALRADVNSCDKDRIYPLENAARLGRLSTVRRLLDRGADVDAKDPYGRHRTPLGWAAEMGHETIVQLLVETGADINAQGGQYGNALHGKTNSE